MRDQTSQGAAVPRGERPLERADDALTCFAAELRALRHKAGSPPYRQLARSAHYSSTTLADAAGGRKLPSLAVTLAYAGACGGDLAHWEARWRRAADELAPAQPDRVDGAPGTEGPCPYVGLASFQPEDAERFFGRERLTDEVVARVRAGRFLGVFGASGSGKSSLLRAGVLPRLRCGPPTGPGSRPTLLFTPGAHPIEECAAKLAALGGLSVTALHGELQDDPRALHLNVLRALSEHPPGTDLLIVVDQFEEAFTLCADPQERALFISALVTAAQAANSRTRVLLGVRADFYAHCSRFPDLVEALRDAHLLVGPMTTDELRRAISEPATAAGAIVEGALLAQVVADATGQANVLPLVSHALRETWRRRRGHTLTLAEFEACGGIRHALTRTAEDLYTSLSERRRAAARTILLRLVALGEGTDDTRRRVRRADLDDTDQSGPVLEALAAARLVTLDRDTVEITHEALLHAWPRLSGWISENRTELLLRQQLHDDAQHWEREGRDGGLLYRGGRLDAARAWATSSEGGADPLPQRAREFLTASVRHEQRAARTRQAVVAVLTVLALIASGAAVLAFQQRASARTARDRAVAGQALAEADQLRPTDPSLAAQLTLASYRLDPTADAYSALLDAENTALSYRLTGSTDAVSAVAYSPDGHTVAGAGADGVLRLWRLAAPGRPEQLVAGLDLRSHSIHALAYAPQGRLVAAAADDGSIRLVDVADPTHPRPLANVSAVGSSGSASAVAVAFSPDGRVLMTAGSDGAVSVWSVTEPTHPTQLARMPDAHGPPTSLAVSADGRTLAVTERGGTVELYGITAAGQPAGPVAVAVGSTDVYGAAFSPDGHLLALACGDQKVRLVDLRDPAHPAALGQPLSGHTDVVRAVVFGPDGRTLASAAGDGTVRLWNLSDPTSPIPLGHPLTGHTGAVYALAFGPDGRTLVSAAADHTLRVWQLPTGWLTGARSYVNAVALSSDGRLLASAGNDQIIQIWNIADPQHPVQLSTVASGHTLPIVWVSFSPDGRTLVSTARDGTARLWRITDPVHPAVWGPPLTYGPDSIAMAVFSPDGRLLATTGKDRAVHLWNITDPAHPVALGTPLTGSTDYVYWTGFSPDGRTLATASADDTVRLWNIADPTRPTASGPPLDTHSGGLEYAAFSPDGRTLATAGLDHTVRLWDVSDRSRPLALGQPLVGHTSWAYWVAFLPNGRTLASSSDDGTVRLWDVADPALAQPLGRPLTTHTGPIDEGAVSPDGRLIASASDDRTVQLTVLDPKAAIGWVCATSADTLTPQTWRRYLPELPYHAPCP
ncbi:hypothetical protein ACFZB9_07275 [Kitasatospora sp. NPDC008050]|uniref:nSTAND1 domain-containing NTPase n=1 Tax=Kitasatospora sp. NPDC008050 TaxID=3364021 RepID=UPI0036DFF1AD